MTSDMIFDLTLSYAYTDPQEFTRLTALAAATANRRPSEDIEHKLVEKFAALSGQNIGGDFILMNGGSNSLRTIVEASFDDTREISSGWGSSRGMVRCVRWQTVNRHWGIIDPHPEYLADVISAADVGLEYIYEADLSESWRLISTLNKLSALFLIMPNNPSG